MGIQMCRKQKARKGYVRDQVSMDKTTLGKHVVREEG